MFSSLRPVVSQTGVPLLKVNAAQSQVAVPVRQVFVPRYLIVPTFPMISMFTFLPFFILQAMLKTIFDHYSVLYELILPAYPTIASEHALRQEEEVYKVSTKFTYRNVGPSLLLRILGNHNYATGCHHYCCFIEAAASA